MSVGVEDAAGPAAHDAQRQSKPVGVLESHHRRDGLNLLLAGVLRGGDGLGELVHPAASIRGTDVLAPWDPLSEVRRGGPIHGFPLLEPGIDLVVGELPVVGHLLRLDREQASLVAHSLSRAEPEWHLEGHPSHRSVDQAALAPTAGGRTRPADDRIPADARVAGTRGLVNWAAAYASCIDAVNESGYLETHAAGASRHDAVVAASAGWVRVAP